MIQLPYRDGDRMEVGGGDLPDYTLLPNDELINDSTDHNRSNELLGQIGKQKRNTKSYKTELKAMTKERNRWRWTCFGLVVSYVIGLLIALFLN